MKKVDSEAGHRGMQSSGHAVDGGKGGLRKIADEPKPCLHPEHNPPSHIVLSPGTYEYTCPGCGERQTFRVPLVTC